jgi:hypothetical protein
LTIKKDKFEVKTQKIPKSKRADIIQYVFVVFKNCETQEHAIKIFQKDSSVQKLVSKIFCISTPQVKKERTYLMGYELNVEDIVEPDDIKWENLSFTGTDQNIRAFQTGLIVLFFVAFTTVFTLYMNGSSQLLSA